MHRLRRTPQFCIYGNLWTDRFRQDVDSKDQNCINKEFVRSTSGTLCCTFWSKFAGSGIIIFERFPTSKVYAWTDSTVTLAWLQEFTRKWKTFVANRAAKIQNINSSSNWNFVPTEKYPADCASQYLSRKPSQTQPLVEWNPLVRKRLEEDYWLKASSIE